MFYWQPCFSQLCNSQPQPSPGEYMQAGAVCVAFRCHAHYHDARHDAAPPPPPPPASAWWAPMIPCSLGTREHVRLRGRDECVTAYMPQSQWDLLQQSLKAHSPNGSEADVATSVVVEAGVLVRAFCLGAHRDRKLQRQHSRCAPVTLLCALQCP